MYLVYALNELKKKKTKHLLSQQLLLHTPDVDNSEVETSLRPQGARNLISRSTNKLQDSVTSTTSLIGDKDI